MDGTGDALRRPAVRRSKTKRPAAILRRDGDFTRAILEHRASFRGVCNNDRCRARHFIMHRHVRQIASTGAHGESPEHRAFAGG